MKGKMGEGFESYYFSPKEGFKNGDPATIQNGLLKHKTEYRFVPYFFKDNEAINVGVNAIRDPHYMPFQYAYTSEETYIRSPVTRVNSERNKPIFLDTDSFKSDQKYETMRKEGAVPFLVGLLTANLNNYAFRKKFMQQREEIAYLCFGGFRFGGLLNSKYESSNYEQIKRSVAVACFQEMNADFLAHYVNVPPRRHKGMTKGEFFRQWGLQYPWLGLTLNTKSYNSELALKPEVEWLESHKVETKSDYTKYITVHKPKQDNITINPEFWDEYIGRGGG